MESIKLQRLATYEPDLETPTPLSELSTAVEFNQIADLKAILGRLPTYDPSLNEGSRPPLHRAVISKNFAAIAMLVRHGASLKTRDSTGLLPIELSVNEGADSIFFMLQESHEKQNIPINFDELKTRAADRGHNHLVTAMEALIVIDDELPGK